MEEFKGLEAELSGRVLKIFYSVANELGYGFFVSVYRRSMVISLREAGLRVAEEVPMPVTFHGMDVGVFVADIVVNDLLILELKAAEEVTRAAETQLTHYLRSSAIEVGYVLAFGQRARFKRLIFTNDRKVGWRQSKAKDSTDQNGKRTDENG